MDRWLEPRSMVVSTEEPDSKNQMSGWTQITTDPPTGVRTTKQLNVSGGCSIEGAVTPTHQPSLRQKYIYGFFFYNLILNKN